MSFRARLTTFFVLIVVIPMAAMGALVFALIDGSATGKADARAVGIADTAASVYTSSSQRASLDARVAARTLALIPPRRLRSEARALQRSSGLARITVRVGHGREVSVGSPSAIAPGITVVRAAHGRPARTVTVAELTAAQFARQLAGSGIAVVVRQNGTTLGASQAAAAHVALPARRGTVAIGAKRYRAVTETFAGFGHGRVSVTVLSDLAATGGAVTSDRILAGAFLVAFLVLAFFFTLLASRGLQTQVSRFLDAARRLGSGDFSEPVQTTGRDEFAALGEEFNSMSRQLRDRLEQLELERARFRASVRRIGEAFASGLDRDALLELMLQTAIDATESECGRVLAHRETTEPLREAHRVGDLSELQAELDDAERRAQEGGLAKLSAGDVQVASVALGALDADGPSQGVITVGRRQRPFSVDDLELLRSLAARATLALANVERHDDVARQAVTDDLTGLATRGRFQELLDVELREVARYGHPVALAMFDLDNFKSVNDTHGHLQGDLVLRRVAEALRETCREADVAARYGGEELALILPHTDLDGAYELAERARLTVERMAIPRLDTNGWLKVTTSVGVAATTDGRKAALVSAADGALYAAKRAGKNRTVRAEPAAGEDDRARELARSTGAPPGE